MDPLAIRVAARFATRPIPIDKGAIRQLADDLAKKIAAYASRQRYQDMLLGDDSKLFDWQWKAKAVKGEDIKVYGVVASARSPSPNLVTGASTFMADLLDDGDVVVRIRLNGNHPFSDFLDAEHQGANGLRYQLNDVLVHEMTHVAEFWYMHQKPEEQHPMHNPELSDEGRQKQLNVYYNTPHEVRAYMQQIIEEIMPKAASFKRRVPSKDNHDFVMKLLHTSTRWKQVSPHLNSANEAKILKAVYDALTHAGVL